MGLEHVRFAQAETNLVFRNAACVVTMSGNASAQSSEHELGLLKNADVVVLKGKIAAIGTGAAKRLQLPADIEEIDASRWVLMPGLVDAHNHPLFAGTRAHETVMKARGLSYEEIAARGGGISATTKATRAASSQELQKLFVRNAQTALSRGVVLMEAKTGYGLNPQEELRHLECIFDGIRSEKRLPRISPTVLSPHAASPDFSGLDSYLQACVDFLPQYAQAAKKARAENLVHRVSADIFVERNYFLAEHGEKWLGSALNYGFDVHVHADEFSRSGGCELALALAQRLEQDPEQFDGRVRVLSVDHCQYATESDLSRLSQYGVVAVALPTTSFHSSIPYVDAKRWRSSGVRVAIASDFNPGSSPMNNLWFSAYLGLTKCGFSMEEIYAAVTKNAAYALAAEKEYGVLDVGRSANIVAFAGTRPEDLFASPLGEHLELVLINAAKEQA